MWTQHCKISSIFVCNDFRISASAATCALFCVSFVPGILFEGGTALRLEAAPSTMSSANFLFVTLSMEEWCDSEKV